MGDRVSNQEDFDAKTGDFGEILSCFIKAFKGFESFFTPLFYIGKL